MRMILSAAAACALLAGCGGDGAGNDTAAPAGNDTAAAANGNGSAAAPAPAGKSILDTLTASEEHKTLAAAVKAAGLTETLSGAQPYTLFAPTDAAFAKLPAGTVDTLMAAEGKPQLVALLTGHIVPGVVTANDLGRAMEKGKGNAKLATVGGTTLSFTKNGEAVAVTAGTGQAQLGRAEQLQSNGVIHPVDGVLAGAQ